MKRNAQMRNSQKTKAGVYLKKNYQYYLMLLPVMIYVTIFCLMPRMGIVLAFKDYDMFCSDNPFFAIFKSPWAGLEHFEKLFKRPEFLRSIRNTLIINVGKLIFSFPVPIIFAIFLSEVRSVKYQKGLQTIVYLPHFLSWAVVSGIFVSLLSSTGLVNSILVSMGFEKVNFLMSNELFRGVLILSSIWKDFGWSSIIYFAAIAGLDQECYEAAAVDGANRFQKMWYITLPGLLPTIVLMLITRVGNILEGGFSQVFAMYNPTVYETADIIDTYVYRIGLGKMDFSMGTAVGLFNSVIGTILVVTTNRLSKKWSGKSMW